MTTAIQKYSVQKMSSTQLLNIFLKLSDLFISAAASSADPAAIQVMSEPG